ncbi:hypothetical protein [Pseudomonas sp. 2FE]|uniref:hypothetical protein n=1 Tax=Pseudomonas sp. 2FE TaxID=2502190 RepID=UPI0010F79766|nr:hypothetical protein [Pseudomonas sp. 2FE]
MNATPRWTPKTRATASLAVLLLLAGCVHAPPAPSDACVALFAARDRVSAATHDAQYQPLADFHGLRSDRVLAALGPTAQSPEQRRLWLQRLAERDAEASAIELGNLPPRTQQDWNSPARQSQLHSCRTAQRERLLHNEHDFSNAVAAAQVPDDYRDWARTLGLYPLFKPIYQRSIAAWQAEAAKAQEPVDNANWLAYQPLPDAAAFNPALQEDALGLPQPDPQQRAALFAHHAPWLRIAQRSPADRLGSPFFLDDGQRGFDQQAPQLFQQIGWSKLNGHWRLQLIYQFWFSQRPKAHALDIYGGELDGLLWRVTLDEHGRALLYDSIHPCGCWQNFFLPADSSLKFRQPADLEARTARRLESTGDRAPTLWLSASEHSVLWVDGRRPQYPAIGYQQRELSSLRQLRHPQGQRSLYASDGLVPGSERLERWLLWPSGVVSPGAMRQWGRHATAFSGRAQFDDPALLERYFSAP